MSTGDDTFDMTEEERDYLVKRREAKQAGGGSDESAGGADDAGDEVKQAATLASEQTAKKMQEANDAANVKALHQAKVEAAQGAIKATLAETENFGDEDFEDVQAAVGRELQANPIETSKMTKEEVAAKVGEVTSAVCAKMATKAKRWTGEEVTQEDRDEFDARLAGAEASSSSAKAAGGATPAASKNPDKVEPMKFGDQDRRKDFPTGDELNDRHEHRKAAALKEMKV